MRFTGPGSTSRPKCDLFIEFWEASVLAADVFLFGDPAATRRTSSDGQSNWEATRLQRTRAAGIRTRDRWRRPTHRVIESVRYLNEALRSDPTGGSG